MRIMALLAIPALLVAGAVWVDLRTRRGYGLALLAVALVALSAWGLIAFVQAIQQAQLIEQYGVGGVLAAYLLVGAYLALLLWIGALVEAGVSRQGWWIAGLVASALLPGLLMFVDALFNLDAREFGFLRNAELALLFILPAVTVVTFSVVRVLRLRARAN